MEKIVEISADGCAFPILLRDYLRFLNLSTAVIKEAKRTGIFLNGEAVTVRATVNKGDLVEVYISDAKSENIVPMDIPLTVLYEDDDILAVDKPTNMPTHPSKGNNLPTLANAVMSFVASHLMDGVVDMAKPAFVEKLRNTKENSNFFGTTFQSNRYELIIGFNIF